MKPASFIGKSNKSKVKVLAIVYAARFNHGIRRGLGVQELAERSGVSYGYVRTRAPKWAKWGYLRQRTGHNRQGRPVFTYALGSLGRRFIEKIVPRSFLDNCIDEIKADRS